MQTRILDRTLRVGNISTTLLHTILERYDFPTGIAVLISSKHSHKGEIWFYDTELNFKWKAESSTEFGGIGYVGMWKSDTDELWGNDSFHSLAKIELHEGRIVEQQPYV